MTIWFNLVFDPVSVLGKLMPSIMVLVTLLDSPLCRGCSFFSVAVLLDVLSAPTHGTLLLLTTLLVVMIIGRYGD